MDSVHFIDETDTTHPTNPDSPPGPLLAGEGGFNKVVSQHLLPNSPLVPLSCQERGSAQQLHVNAVCYRAG